MGTKYVFEDFLENIKNYWEVIKLWYVDIRT